jgi:hypothetical protein
MDSGILAQMGEADSKVLLCLVSHANFEDATAWPSRATIERETGLCHGAVGNALNRLVGLKIIKLEKRKQRGKREGNLYILKFVQTDCHGATGVDRSTGVDGHGATGVAVHGATGMAPNSQGNSNMERSKAPDPAMGVAGSGPKPPKEDPYDTIIRSREAALKIA